MAWLLLLRERHCRLIGASMGASFTDLIDVASSADVASRIDVGTIIRRCYD